MQILNPSNSSSTLSTSLPKNSVGGLEKEQVDLALKSIPFPTELNDSEIIFRKLPAKKVVVNPSEPGLNSATANCGTKILTVNAEVKPFANSNLQSAYLKYKIKTKTIKAKIHNKQVIAKLENYPPKLKKEIEKLETKLNRVKQRHPVKLDAIDKIYRYTRSKDLSRNKKINLKTYIGHIVFRVKKDIPQKLIDFQYKHFFVLSKGSLGDPHVFEIAMRTNKIGEGSFGEVFRLKYINEHKFNAAIGPKVMKIAKESQKGALKDIVIEGKNLAIVGGKRGIQQKPTLEFDGGYIIDEMEGCGITLINKENHKEFYIPEERKIQWTEDLIAGKDELKKQKMLQFDLKPENMLYNAYKLVLSDFGGVRFVHEILKPKSLPESVDDLFPVITPRHVSMKIYKNLDCELTKTKLAIRRLKEKFTTGELDGDSYEKLRLRHIDLFNTATEPSLYENIDFAFGLSLYIIWTKRFPPLESFIDLAKMKTRLTISDYTNIRFNLVSVPAKITNLILTYLQIGLD